MQKLFGVCLTSGGMVHGQRLEYDPILPELREIGIGNSSSKFAIFRTQAWICSQCLPILIHHPQELAGKLSGAESLPPFQHDHD